MEVLSKQVTNEQYKYLMPTAATQFFFVKGRPGMTLEITNLTIYVAGANNATKMFQLIKHNGAIHRIDYDSSITTLTTWRTEKTTYLVDGDEMGIEIKGGAALDPVEICVSYITWCDADIEKKLAA